MTDRVTILFKPKNLKTTAEKGANLLETARLAGINITASCGGDGVCGTCKVIIEEGDVEEIGTNRLSIDQRESGFKLACQCQLSTDLVVNIPPSSLMSVTDGHLQSLITNAEIKSAKNWRFAPLVFKQLLTIPPPQLADNSSDLNRLKQALEKNGVSNIRFSLDILKNLPSILREGKWSTTLTLSKEPTGLRLVNLEPGDTRKQCFGLVFDIGTTGIRGELLNLNEGQVLAQAVEYNSQRKYGDDIISRISYAGKTNGLANLNQAVVATINQMISNMVRQAGIAQTELCQIVIAANTTMVQLLLGIEPRYLRLNPYVPAVSVLPPLSAGEIGLAVGVDVPVNIAPSVASYLGGDIVAGVVGTGIFQQNQTALYIDIGTNGEIVLGNSEWMIGASCSAGPAFEGGGITNGMLATSGAIDSLRIEPSNGQPRFTTIGGNKPKGICGAGIISAAAGLLIAGIIDQKGRLQPSQSRYIREGVNGLEFLVVGAEYTETGQDIIITEADLDNLVRAKAAMYAGYQTLIQSVDMTFDQVDEVILAGTFGSHIDIEDAVTIGLLPDIDRNKFLFVGNGSLLGARLISFSTELEEASIKVARMLTNMEFSENTSFMDNYMAALFLPHTETNLFPSFVRKASDSP